jgi:cysteine-rich repeat protein
LRAANALGMVGRLDTRGHIMAGLPRYRLASLLRVVLAPSLTAILATATISSAGEPPVPPDLTISTANSVSGQATAPGGWTWSITVTNVGDADATFANGQNVFVDNLPSSGLTYGIPSLGAASGTNGSLTCTGLTADFTCSASGPFVISPGGFFTLDYPVLTSTFGTYDNPRAGGVCRVDPDGFISEQDETNNDCALDTVVVIGCGDGSVTGSEACDDGNNDDGDGCSATCTVEAGFTCTGESSVCTPICGDGVVKGQLEECDDANTDDGDGCSATCTVEAGFSCSGEPSVCTQTSVCGNGGVEPGEQCDDGNTDNGDCCSSSCQLQDCTLAVQKDSFLRTIAHDKNEGANTILSVKRNGHHRAVVGFDLSGKNPSEVVKATLVLTVKKNLQLWDGGRAVEAHALNQDFPEGNGKKHQRGSGPGVTFECSTDTNIANHATNCSGSEAWDGGDFVSTPSDSVTHTNATTGEVSFDVTSDVQGGVSDWLVKKANEKLTGGVRYYSREGAAKAGDPNLAPKLELEYGGGICLGANSCIRP